MKSLFRANTAPNVVTLSLRFPSQDAPVQQWTFVDQPVIKIGRCSDNHIVLHSSVVSRHHIELRRIASEWKAVSFSNNGTYLNGEPITEAVVTDGIIVRLAMSGPQLQIHLTSSAPSPLLKSRRVQGATALKAVGYTAYNSIQD
ncbi:MULTISPECIES: FHA domain-containing protein [unclassified Coleofasciculus]|uniref:FHA domain-containing protein n=1 Tax=unclassified Coleofasciculus TaxID=2692782 RepID=UPI0018820BBF|nr:MULTISPECIES: FHA domain-containing protein [unclassified Coleofasciculus]MBE9125364.1 FHA domain-containing protein [Coleofasciculus sp. LEGE 07081]MBE9147419.1 FHA domain-containing protein [Coleofasciculus sp. LEGE 07092]